MILQLIDVDLEKTIYHSEKSLVVQRGGGRYTQVRVGAVHTGFGAVQCTPRFGMNARDTTQISLQKSITFKM